MTSKRSNLKKYILIVLCGLLVLLLVYFSSAPILTFLYRDFQAPAPKVHSEWESRFEQPVQGDIYVSKKGSDENAGTKNSPFLTVERALQAVESMDRANKSEITVCIESGRYSINSLNLSERHGGTEACRIIYRSYGDGEVILNAGLDLASNDFVKAADYPEIDERLSQSAKSNVYVLDLTKAPYGLNEGDWGKLYPIGTYNTANRYQGNNTGAMYSELFINGERRNLARYPNDGYIYTDSVVGVGKELENKPNGDPASDVLEVNDELTARIRSWGDLENVWMYGFWQYDWADGSTPIQAFDREKKQLTTKYQSFFGVRENAPYYFYNCLEEFDSDEEWYLDRENGLLCVYSSTGLKNAEITMSVSTDSALSINASYVTLYNITVTGTRVDGVLINGNNNVVEHCKIGNVGGRAIQVFGDDNVITRNEISHTGRGGIAVVGGDWTQLRSGNNVIENNVVHDWSQVYKTYQAGIDLGGVGNVCAHNELFNSPHLAVKYSGNNHLVEYNLIHDVCLETDDAGAIYAGKSWSAYSNDVRYNLIYNIGGERTPSGIYMDDALSGQNVYGNILINIPKHAIFIGGGRDMKVYGNLIVNPGDAAIRYDARAREGILNETWFSGDVEELWRTLYGSPWKSELWQTAFPLLQGITDNLARIDEPSFMANPSNSVVKDNVIFDKDAVMGNLDQAVYDYSTVSDNKTCYLFQLGGAFKNYKKGNYSVREKSSIYQPHFNDVIEKVGRY